MGRSKMHVEARGYVDDDPSYSYAVVIEAGPQEDSWDWVELFLENVDERAHGEQRLVNARVVARLWFGETHFDFPYADALSHLEKARTLLLESEPRVPPE